MKTGEGWGVVGGYTVWVEGGMVTRAILGEGQYQRTGYVYRKQGSGWTSAGPVTPAALRSGLRRGTYAIL